MKRQLASLALILLGTSPAFANPVLCSYNPANSYAAGQPSADPSASELNNLLRTGASVVVHTQNTGYSSSQLRSAAQAGGKKLIICVDDRAAKFTVREVTDFARAGAEVVFPL